MALAIVAAGFVVGDVAAQSAGDTGSEPRAATGRTLSRVFTLDPDWFGGTIGYAWRLGHGRYAGVALGLGGALEPVTRFTRPEFAAGIRTSAARSAQFAEFAHVSAFRRWAPGSRASAEAGMRLAGLLRTGGPAGSAAWLGFVGVYGSAFVGAPKLKLGTRLLVGGFGDRNARTLGVLWVPLTARLEQGW